MRTMERKYSIIDVLCKIWYDMNVLRNSMRKKAETQERKRRQKNDDRKSTFAENAGCINP